MVAGRWIRWNWRPWLASLNKIKFPIIHNINHEKRRFLLVSFLSLALICIENNWGWSCYPQPFDGPVVSRKPDGTVFEGNFKRGTPHGYFRSDNFPKSYLIFPFADTSTLLETSSSSVALFEASSMESVGDPFLGEDFLSPRITSFRGAMSSFSIQTAGEEFMRMKLSGGRLQSYYYHTW